MVKYTLDNIDIHILSLLQQNSRLTNADLAKQVGLSQPPCLRRVKLLEQQGYITGYSAKINEEKCGFPVMVFAFVRLKTQSKQVIDDFTALINDWDMVRESYMISGEADFLLRIVAKDWVTYRKFLTETLMPSPDIATVRSNLCIEQNKTPKALPIV